MEEVRMAVFQRALTKALGLDGLNDQFYHHQWEIIRFDIFHMVKNFFHLGSLDSKINKIYISLVPKVPNPETVS